MKRYAVYGGSGFGREVMPVLRKQLERTGQGEWDLVFVDDDPQSDRLNGHPVLRYAEWKSAPAEGRYVTLAIANSKIRETLAQRCSADGVKFVDVAASNVVMMDEIA